jgi:hypothetical protein
MLERTDRLHVLRFTASFLWADLEVVPDERAFFLSLARELGSGDAELEEIGKLLSEPPRPERVDPTRVRPELAGLIRDAALRAIASDGAVEPREMELFDLLDELLPPYRSPPVVGTELHLHR